MIKINHVKLTINEGENNFFGRPMLEHPPFGRFTKLTQDKSDGLAVNTIQGYNLKGCILELDLETPEEVHGF